MTISQPILDIVLATFCPTVYDIIGNMVSPQDRDNECPSHFEPTRTTILMIQCELSCAHNSASMGSSLFVMFLGRKAWVQLFFQK